MLKDEKKIDLSQKIMKQIKKKHVKIRPRVYFISGSILLGIGLTGVITVSIFFINLVIFKLRLHGPFDYLLFGRFGLRPFFMVFP